MQPASSRSSNGSSTSGRSTPFALADDRPAWRPSPTCRCARRASWPARSTNAARAFAISGASRSRSLALSSSSRARSTIDSGGHAATVSSTATVDGDRAAALLVLLQRRHQDRPALEHQPLGPAHHAVDDRAFEQCAAGADHHPAEPGQPAALVQRPQEPLAVATVLRRDVDVHPVRPRQRFAGIGARQSGAGGTPRDAGHVA